MLLFVDSREIVREAGEFEYDHLRYRMLQIQLDVHQNPSLYLHSSTLLLMQDALSNDIINYIKPID